MITEEKVIEQFKNKHKDSYDYSLVVYINNLTRVKIICKEHGMFEQTPQSIVDILFMFVNHIS